MKVCACFSHSRDSADTVAGRPRYCPRRGAADSQRLPRSRRAALTHQLSKRTTQYSRSSRLDAVSLRMDHSLSEKITLFGRYNRAPSYTQSGFAQVEHFHLSSSSVTLGFSAAPAPGVTNDLRANGWSTDRVSHWSANPDAGGIPLDFAQVVFRDRRIPRPHSMASPSVEWAHCTPARPAATIKGSGTCATPWASAANTTTFAWGSTISA